MRRNQNSMTFISRQTHKESQIHKQTQIYISQLILINMHSQFNGERTVLSTNGPGTAADPCVKTHFKSYLTSYTKWTQNANTKHIQ